MEEIWKDIPDYEGLYKVSNLGRVKSLCRTVSKNNGNYSIVPEKIIEIKENASTDCIRLHRNTHKKPFAISRLVAMAFMLDFKKDKIVCKKMQESHKNELSNLYLSTRKERMDELLKNGDLYLEDGKYRSYKKLEEKNSVKVLKEIGDLDGEIWKDVMGYEGYYKISNKGRLKSTERMVIMKNGKCRLLKERVIDKNKKFYLYPMVSLRKDRKTTNFLLHRILGIHFIPNPLNKPQINHIDGDKNNFSLNNLEWASSSENLIHSLETGLRKVKTGEASLNTLSSNKEVEEMLSLIDGGLSNTEVGNMYGYGRKYVERLVRFRRMGLDLTKKRSLPKKTKSKNIQYIHTSN